MQWPSEEPSSTTKSAYTNLQQPGASPTVGVVAHPSQAVKDGCADGPTRRVHRAGCGGHGSYLGLAVVAAEAPELEAWWRERLHYAGPSVLAATEDPQGRRDLNLFARDWVKYQISDFRCQMPLP